MFYYARSFNQPIGGWDVSKGTNFVSGLNPVARRVLLQTFADDDGDFV